MVLVVNDTELAGGYAMDFLLAMDDIGTVGNLLDCCLMPFGGVAYLEGDTLGKIGKSEKMEVVDRKILLIGCLRVVAMGDIENVVLYILLDNKPWTATKTKSLALTDGVKPQSLVGTYAATCLQLDNISRIITEITLDIFVVIDLAEKTDAL